MGGVRFKGGKWHFNSSTDLTLKVFSLSDFSVVVWKRFSRCCQKKWHMENARTHQEGCGRQCQKQSKHAEAQTILDVSSWWLWKSKPWVLFTPLNSHFLFLPTLILAYSVMWPWPCFESVCQYVWSVVYECSAPLRVCRSCFWLGELHPKQYVWQLWLKF